MIAMLYRNKNTKGGRKYIMKATTPIKKISEMNNMKIYYREIKLNYRNQLLIVLGLNTALRISDILALTWEAVYDFKSHRYKEHITITEQKTKKLTKIYINENLLEALINYKEYLSSENKAINPDDYLFCHKNKNVAISRVQAFRIIKEAADYYHISGTISCHSLRKTFGYHAWRQGVHPALLVTIFNHSSFEITKRYLGIEQDEKDEIFKNIKM